MKLKVIQHLENGGVIYLAGDTIEVTEREGAELMRLYPGVFSTDEATSGEGGEAGGSAGSSIGFSSTLTYEKNPDDDEQ